MSQLKASIRIKVKQMMSRDHVSIQHYLFTFYQTTLPFKALASTIAFSFIMEGVSFLYLSPAHSHFCSKTQSLVISHEVKSYILWEAPSCVFASVDRALEDEFDVALLPRQPSTAEGTGSVEGMRAVGQWDLAPSHHCLFRAHMATGTESMCGGAGIQVQSTLTA